MLPWQMTVIVNKFQAVLCPQHRGGGGDVLVNAPGTRRCGKAARCTDAVDAAASPELALAVGWVFCAVGEPGSGDGGRGR